MPKGSVISRDKVRCGCGTCSTYAIITRHTCPCVRVEIFNDRAPCAQCTNFSRMRFRCSKC